MKTSEEHRYDNMKFKVMAGAGIKELKHNQNQDCTHTHTHI